MSVEGEPRESELTIEESGAADASRRQQLPVAEVRRGHVAAAMGSEMGDELFARFGRPSAQQSTRYPIATRYPLPTLFS